MFSEQLQDPDTLADLNLAARRELIRRRIPRIRLYDFGKQAWPIIEPSTPLIENWHMGAVAEHLEAVALGQIRKLIINQPPGTSKSTWLSVMWQPWIWTFWPGFRGIFTAYHGPLATRDCMKSRRIIDSKWYKEEFAFDWAITHDQNEKTLFENTATGIRQSFGRGTGGLGFRGHAVACDDPINADDVKSPKERKKCIDWWNETISQRGSDPKTFMLIVTMQRLHDEDLSGYLIKQGGYQLLKLPTEYNPKRSVMTVRIVEGQEVVWEDPRTETGELIDKQRYSPELVAEAKRILHTAYSGQHDQEPALTTGNIFKKDRWRFWKPDGVAPASNYPRPTDCWDGPAIPLPLEFDDTLISIDCSFKKTTDGSKVAFGAWARKAARFFRLGGLSRRMDFTEMLFALKIFCNLYPMCGTKLVEDKANGPALISIMQEEIAGLEPREPRGSKEARAHAISYIQNSGNVYIQDGDPDNEEYISEMSLFPNGTTDDMVDETTQALLEWSPGSDSVRANILCQQVYR